jgi:hypothetical protein
MKLEDTLKNHHQFLAFTTALMTISKFNKVLLEGGADPEAIKHINAAIRLISKQLDSAAIRIETELQAVKSIDALSRKLGIPRANL